MDQAWSSERAKAKDEDGNPYWEKPDGSVLQDLKANMGFSFQNLFCFPSRIWSIPSCELTFFPWKVTFEDAFPNFPRWDMLISWRVCPKISGISPEQKIPVTRGSMGMGWTSMTINPDRIFQEGMSGFLGVLLDVGVMFVLIQLLQQDGAP